MLITEWDTEEAKEVWFEEGHMKGIEEGRMEGIEEGRIEGIEEGREEGWLELARLLREGRTLDEAMIWLKDQNNTAISESI